MTFVHVETLEGLRLPEASSLRRDHVLPPERRKPDYLSAYDDRTLFYDAVAIDPRRVLVTAPVAYNLWPVLRGGFEWDSRAAKSVRPWRHPRYEQLTLRREGGDLSFALESDRYPVKIRESHAAQFSGLNALVVVNKNNDLAWIRDWLLHYIHAHGLEALVVYDNLSDRYSAQDLADAAASTGLKAVAVYSAPFPYGPPVRSADRKLNGRLLQTAMLNLARRDVLSSARAVLNVDIDEIVVTQDGRSVFDMAYERRFGFVKIHGSWVYPTADATLPASHAAHLRRAEPDERCNQKWCVSPRSVLSRFGWAPHHVGGALVKVVKATPGIRLYHCKGTSTGWKKKRFEFPAHLTQSPELESLFAVWP